ncbi:MAG: hypothetical protein JWO31_536 [Phycisphaerales bacterium]|nr:hypothetical protein [Phycisphaerales bacterium]
MSTDLVRVTASEPTAADPLRLSQCPGCGYALTGLPDAGTCPECGAAYDRDREVVLFGHGTGTMGDPTNESDKAFAVRMLLGLINPVLFWLIYRSMPGWSGVWAVWLITPASQLAVRAVVWANRPPRGMVRVRLSPDAVRQEDLVPAAAAFGRRLAIAWAVAFAVVLAVALRTDRSFAEQAPWVWVAIAAMVVATYVSARQRRDPGLPRPRSWLPWSRRRVLANPWADSENVQLGEEKPGVYRLRCPPSQPFVGRTYADAQVRLSPAEADALRARMRAWRRAASDADADADALT